MRAAGAEAEVGEIETRHAREHLTRANKHTLVPFSRRKQAYRARQAQGLSLLRFPGA